MQRASQNIHFGFRPAEISALPNLSVIAEHASEAGFLWSQQRRAVRAPHFRLDQLRSLHERLQAHLEGLLVAGAAGWRAALDALATAEPGAVFTAAWVSFRTEHRDGMRHVVALAAADAAFADAVVSALGWLPWSSLEWSLARLAQSSVPAYRRIAVAARSAHRAHTVESLRSALRDEDAGVRAHALRAMGRQRLAGLRDVVHAAYQGDDDPDCRFAAAVSLALLQECGPALRAWDFASDSPSLRREALNVAMRLGNPADGRQLIRTLAAEPSTAREAVLAVGAFGDPFTMPWLIDRCDDTALAPIAGEAISMITGLDLDLEGLSMDAPAAESDRHPEDEQLAYPDSAGLAAWWRHNATAFEAGKRHLAGEPIGVDHAVRVLRSGYQRQRAAAALELSWLRPGRPGFDVERRADLQLTELRA